MSKIHKNAYFAWKKPTQTVYKVNTLLWKFNLVLLDAGMCKKALFINLNHVGCLLVSLWGHKFFKISQNGYLAWKKPTLTVYWANTLL